MQMTPMASCTHGLARGELAAERDWVEFMPPSSSYANEAAEIAATGAETIYIFKSLPVKLTANRVSFAGQSSPVERREAQLK
jgi:hypothetical protein